MTNKKYIVVSKHNNKAYIWDYLDNQYYEMQLLENDNCNRFDVLDINNDSYEISYSNAVLTIKSKELSIIGPINYSLFFEKVGINKGEQLTSFEELFGQRENNGRIISLVKFTGSEIINGQLRIKHKNDYSFCDLLDRNLKKYEGYKFNGTALVEYIPGKRKERCFNLIAPINYRVSQPSKLISNKNSKGKVTADIRGENLHRLFKVNKEYFESMDKYYEEEERKFLEEVEEYESALAEEAMWSNRKMSFSQDYISQDEYDDIIRDGFEDWEDEIYDEYNGFLPDIELNLHGDPVDDYLDVEQYAREMEMIQTSEIIVEDNNSPVVEITESNVIQSVNNLLGKFKVYYINELDHSEFVENCDYFELNLLSPEFIDIEIPKLINTGCFDIDILKKYDKKAKELSDTIRRIFPNLTIYSISDSYNEYLEFLEENAWYVD